MLQHNDNKSKHEYDSSTLLQLQRSINDSRVSLTTFEAASKV